MTNAKSFTVNDPEGHIRERADRIGRRFREAGIGGWKRPRVIGFALSLLDAHLAGEEYLGLALLEAIDQVRKSHD